MRRSSILRTTGIVLITAGTLGAVGAVVVRDQITRHRRNLFSAQALKRFAALGYLSGLVASVELVQVLRDFVAWEPNTLLRRRAVQILARMENQLEVQAAAADAEVDAAVAARAAARDTGRETARDAARGAGRSTRPGIAG